MADDADGKDETETNNRIFQPDIQPTLTDRDDKPFFPWHKPRKHYMRIHQWCAELAELIHRNGYQHGHVVHYLGFPGEDFLDIRVLKGVCERTKVTVRYLGFDSTASYSNEFDFNLSQHEVYHLGCIHEHSKVLKSRLEQIADVRSIAYRRTAEFRAFDIINIDLCDSLASPVVGEHPPYFDAIKNLCDLQVKGRTQPWILFLTTRAVREQIDPRVKKKLFECVRSNIGDNPAFAAELSTAFGLNDAMIANELSEQKLLDHTNLVKLFGLSIGKWLLKMMAEAKPKLRLKLLKSYSYRVETQRTREPDMLSLAFIFEPTISQPVDRTGLSSPTTQRVDEPTEHEQAIDLLRGVNGIQDLDRFLHDDEPTHTKMVQKCGQLLTTAHYDKNKYEEWVKVNRWRPVER